MRGEMERKHTGKRPKLELLRFVSKIYSTYFEISVCFEGDKTILEDLFGKEFIRVSEMQKTLYKYILSIDLSIGETRDGKGRPTDKAPLLDENLVIFRNAKETLEEVFGTKPITFSQMQKRLNEYMWSRDLVAPPGFSSN